MTGPAIAILWNKLENLQRPALAELFADPARLDAQCAVLALPGGAIRFDWSKTHLAAASEQVLERIALAMDFAAKREQLFSGALINNTEGRAATHCAERGNGPPTAVVEAEALHARMAGLVDAIHEGLLGEVRSLIHIGIGGSALGPALAIEALALHDAKVAVH